MKVAELLDKRRQYWQELEQLATRIERERKSLIGAETLTRFATLYRAACADLALADAYHLPLNTIQYLHRLVARAHALLYPSREFDPRTWGTILLVDVPRRIFHDGCVQLMFLLFWSLFLLSAYLAYNKAAFPDYANNILTADGIEQLEQSFRNEINGRNINENVLMAGFYILHNTGIGLQCFGCMLVVVVGLYTVMFNAVFLGAAFGYMARPDVAQGVNFFHFVRAHGPFELTAIVLAAGAGLRLGMSWIMPGELTRGSSLRKSAREAMPIMGASMVLFFLAALIEGFVSPSELPLVAKSTIAALSSGIVTFYFVVLGFPKRA